MAVNHKYSFRFALDLASLGGQVTMFIDSTGGQCLLKNFAVSPAMVAKTLNNAIGDVQNGITLGISPGRPGQVIFESFASSTKGGMFELVVTPAANTSGTVVIQEYSSAYGGILPTTDGVRPAAFGWISWDTSGNCNCSGNVRGSSTQDQNFTGSMSVAG